MNKPVIAKRSDWKNEPMPDKHKTFIYRKTFSEKEMTVLHLGHIPEAMEDKWFWYMEGSVLYAHRSWSGYCIYIIEFKEDGNNVVTVNRDPEQYACTRIQEDRKNLTKLLKWWLQDPYDHYNEWLSEISDALNKL